MSAKKTKTAKLDDKELAWLRTSYDECDANHSNALSQDELLDLLKKLEVVGSNAEGTDQGAEYEALQRDAFIQQSDKDNDGILTFEEFVDCYTIWKAEQTDPNAKVKVKVTWFEGARFEPFAVMTIANCIASIWEDVFDKTEEVIVGEAAESSDAPHWFNVGTAAIHMVVMLIICTLLRFVCAKLQSVRARALTTLAVQITAGWGMKAFVFRVLTAIQLTMAGETSFCEGWLPPTCFVVALTIATLVTAFAAASSFLPGDVPSQACSCRSLGLHFSALLAGGTALPLGYSWHVTVDQFIRSLTVRTFGEVCELFDNPEVEEGEEGEAGEAVAKVVEAAEEAKRRLWAFARRMSEEASYSYEEGEGGGEGGGDEGGEEAEKVDIMEWVAHSSFELATSLVLAIVLGMLKMRFNAYLDLAKANEAKKAAAVGDLSDKKSALSRVRERMRALIAKTCDFLLAWALFDVVAALFASIEPSPCFPSHGGEIAEKWMVLLIASLVLILAGILRELSIRHTQPSTPPECRNQHSHPPPTRRPPTSS